MNESLSRIVFFAAEMAASLTLMVLPWLQATATHWLDAALETSL
jgi:hypothetical protein